MVTLRSGFRHQSATLNPITKDRLDFRYAHNGPMGQCSALVRVGQIAAEYQLALAVDGSLCGLY
jgi:hypothetical protein